MHVYYNNPHKKFQKNDGIIDESHWIGHKGLLEVNLYTLDQDVGLIHFHLKWTDSVILGVNKKESLMLLKMVSIHDYI